MSTHHLPAATPGMRHALAQARHRAREISAPVLVSLAREAPELSDLLSVFAAAGAAGWQRTFWAKPSLGFWSVGVGQATTLRGDGAGRFHHLASTHQSLMANAVVSAPDLPGVGPVCFGGFRFETEGTKDNLWNGFEDGSLLVPRLVLTQLPRGTWSTMNVMVDESSDLTALESSLDDGWATLLSTESGYSGRAVVTDCDETMPDQWRWEVEQSLESIERKQMDKIVLARQKRLRFQEELKVEAVLQRLADAYPSCLVFAMDRGSATFVGATPERLVSLSGGQVSVTCLAGSAPRGATEEQDEQLGRSLLHTDKELREHAYVVEAIRKALRGLCPDLGWDASPTLSKLATVQHLATTFTGATITEMHVLDLVERLHPNPAVCGAPSEEAAQAIQRLEGFDRGWYAGPVGVVYPHGDGEFGLAIRSGLLHSKEAYLYAGAGIVADSDPDAEFAETVLKFQPMLSALTSA
jgi:menaquinone-specific isochorismate synthase